MVWSVLCCRCAEDIKEITCSPHPLARGRLSNSYQVACCPGQEYRTSTLQVQVDLEVITSMGQERISYRFYVKLALEVELGPGQVVRLVTPAPGDPDTLPPDCGGEAGGARGGDTAGVASEGQGLLPGSQSLPPATSDSVPLPAVVATSSPRWT